MNLRRSLPNAVLSCLAAGLLVATASCTAEPRPSDPTRTPQPAPTLADLDVPLARLRQERDDAVHIALHARKEADDARGQCELTQHELDSLRERETFRDLIGSRLDQAEHDERDLQEALARADGARKRAIETALRDASAARQSIDRSLRHVQSVSDVEWPRLKHDVESALEGLDHVLRNLR
jgi:hypothetical protein